MSRDTSKYRGPDGRRWPSVTEVLSIAGLVDFAGVPPDVLEAARQRGQDVHEWAEAIDLGLLSDDQEPDARVASYVAAYRAFKRETGFEVLASEQVVRNESYRYAGTLDRIGFLNGRRVLVDLKTSVSIAPWIGLQLSGYELALPERHQRYALHLLRDGSWKLVPFTSREDAHDFLAAVRLAHYRLRHGLARLEE